MSSRRVVAFTTRFALLVVGAATVAASAAVTLWTGLGPGPLDVFISAVREQTGIPLTFAVWLVVGGLIAVAWMLGRRPGIGTLVGPLLVGPMLQVMVSMLGTFATPSSFLVRFALQTLAIGGIGIGAGAIIVAGLGAGSGELLAGAASDRSGHPETWVRLAFELSWLAFGIALGGPAGVGTVMVALMIGPSVANGFRIVTRAVESPVGTTTVRLLVAATA